MFIVIEIIFPKHPVFAEIDLPTHQSSPYCQRKEATKRSDLYFEVCFWNFVERNWLRPRSSSVVDDSSIFLFEMGRSWMDKVVVKGQQAATSFPARGIVRLPTRYFKLNTLMPHGTEPSAAFLRPAGPPAGCGVAVHSEFGKWFWGKRMGKRGSWHFYERQYFPSTAFQGKTDRDEKTRSNR